MEKSSFFFEKDANQEDEVESIYFMRVTIYNKKVSINIIWGEDITERSHSLLHIFLGI